MRRLALILLTFISITAFATHYRAGEISYKHVSGFTYEITVTTYTKLSSFEADSDTITIYWGDGKKETLYREDPIDYSLSDIRVNQFIAEHTYPAPSLYKIYMQDQNRNGNIVNIPQSDLAAFYIETELLISPQEIGVNNSPILTYPPIDNGKTNQIFNHNTGAYDIDGDSLSYELIFPKGLGGFELSGYQLPDKFPVSSDNQINLDPLRGDFTWTTPQYAGQYNIAIKITEHRNGRIIGTMTRDMQITIVSSISSTPTLNDFEDICVVAGTNIEQEVIASNPSNSQRIYLMASGGPFQVEDNPASFPFSSSGWGSDLRQNFTWNTNCSHIRKSFYTVNFRTANDSYTPTSSTKSWLITVIAPAPENFRITPENNYIQLDWDSLYTCSSHPSFKGFNIWRKKGNSETISEECLVNLEDYGYSKIAFTSNYSFKDSLLEYGENYCYRIEAFFKDGTDAFPYNTYQSLPTLSRCSNLAIDLPIPVNVDVTETDSLAGSIYFRWARPLPSEFDTLIYPGPYQYDVQRSMDSTFTQSELMYTVTSQNYYDPIDSFFIDSNLNTISSQYFYKVGISYRDGFINFGPTASSTFLSSINTDRQVQLAWNNKTPWNEVLYNIYRKDQSSDSYALVASTEANNYTDINLTNDSIYEYYISSDGEYNDLGINDLINRSQIISAIPIDTVAPCSPDLTVSNPCNSDNDEEDIEHYYNHLSWTHPIEKCIESSDVEGYLIYRKYNQSDSLDLILDINDENQLTYAFDSLAESVAACYSVRAYDTDQRNISAFSSITCVDNCPIYELPNVFSPNNDGENDYYIPFRNQRFISSVDFRVYDRWGGLIFQTNDKDIMWDGNHPTTGKPMPEDVYFYTCTIFENRIEGAVEREIGLHGYFNLFR